MKRRVGTIWRANTMPDDELDPEQEERFKKRKEHMRQKWPELKVDQ
jgi:hypothetical protein